MVSCLTLRTCYYYIGACLVTCFDIPFHPMQRRHVPVAADLAAAAGFVVVVVVAASVAAV